MKIVIHNHYNNNSYALGCHKDPLGMTIVNECDVSITKDGLVFILLDKALSLPQKIVMLNHIQQRLQDELGQSATLVTSGASDCIVPHELCPFFKEAKEAIPTTKTVWVDFDQHSANKLMASKDNFTVDAFVTNIYEQEEIADAIKKLAEITDDDAENIEETYFDLQEQLEEIREDAYTKARLTPPIAEPK